MGSSLYPNDLINSSKNKKNELITLNDFYVSRNVINKSEMIVYLGDETILLKSRYFYPGKISPIKKKKGIMFWLRKIFN